MACFSLASGINGACDTSMGGITEVYLTEFADDIFTVTSGGTEVTGVKSGASFYKFNFRKGSSSMTSTLTIDDANGINYVSTELSMTFGKMETAKRVAISALATSELAGIVKDCNGKYWALGLSEAVTASAGEGATGAARGDSNHYSITLVDNHTTFPMEVQASVISGLEIAQ